MYKLLWENDWQKQPLEILLLKEFMGSLAGLEQREEVKEKVLELSKSQEIIYGDLNHFDVVGADKEKEPS